MATDMKEIAIAKITVAKLVENAEDQQRVNGSEELTLHSASIEDVAVDNKVLRIRHTGWVEYQSPVKLATDGGSISFWVKPLWSETDKNSHTLFSLSWGDGRGGYMVLSQGWWEPAGAERLYFVLNNQDYIHCSALQRLVPGFWTFITVTWQNGQHGGCCLYVDGEKVAGVQKQIFSTYYAKSPLILGSDHVTTEKKGRFSEILIDGLAIYAHPLPVNEITDNFLRYKKYAESVEQKRWAWLLDGIKPPVQMKKNKDGTLIETRAIFDEDILWATSRAETDKILTRIKRAGFNVYVPCIWHGKTAYFKSSIAKYDERLRRRIETGDDPLAYLIEKAHSVGIEVHPWLTVVNRSTDEYSEFYSSGTPDSAFDVHNVAFRDFITNLMLDVVRRYQVDGINLDYIRAMGICTSQACRDDYQQRSGNDFWVDYGLRGVPGQARSRLQKWQDEAVAQIVAGFSAAAKAVRPALVISVSGHPQPNDVIRPLEGRDEITWANKGLIDLIFAMDYRERIDFETIDKVRADLNEPNKLIVLFGNYDKRNQKVTPRSGWLVNNYVEYARRKWPESGVAFYLYGQLSHEQVEFLSNMAFNQSSLPKWQMQKGDVEL